MIRQPAFEAVTRTLTQAFADAGVNYGHQRTLNLAAQVQGFKNYAHYLAEVGRKVQLAKPSSAACAAPSNAEYVPTSTELLRDSLEWMTARFEAVLAGRPVRDVDECLAHAKLMMRTATE
jgi:hypothetical protein